MSQDVLMHHGFVGYYGLVPIGLKIVRVFCSAATV